MHSKVKIIALNFNVRYSMRFRNRYVAYMAVLYFMSKHFGNSSCRARLATLKRCNGRRSLLETRARFHARCQILNCPLEGARLLLPRLVYVFRVKLENRKKGISY